MNHVSKSNKSCQTTILLKNKLKRFHKKCLSNAVVLTILNGIIVNGFIENIIYLKGDSFIYEREIL